jgi:putative aldouronate transport system substrate-binding protein
MNWTPLKKCIPVVALAVALTACSGGGGNSGSNVSPSANGSSPSSSSSGTFSFSYMMAAKYINWLKDLAWYPELLKETNTQVNLVEGGQDDADYAKNLDLKIGSGEFPDAGIVSLSQAEVYGKQGVFLDLKPLIDKEAPNIKAFLDQNPDYANLVTDKDGHIYGLMQEYPTITSVTFYRSDMFKKAGITQKPTTIQEFTDDLKKLKETYKSDSKFYPFTGRDSFIKYAEVFDANDKIDANGKVHGIYNGGLGYDLYSPGFKQLIEWYISLYNDKLIDPEWVAGTQTEDSWQTKMLTGKGAVSDDFFTRPAWFMSNGGPKNDPNYDIQVMNPLKTLDGQQSKRPLYAPPLRTDRVMVINAKSKDKADGIIKFMDFVFSEKGRTLMDYGVEGTTYKEENGQKTFITDFSVEAAKPLGTTNNGVYQDRLTFPAPVDNDAYYNFLDKLTKSFAKSYFDNYAAKDFPILKYDADQLKERTNLLAKVQPALDAYIVKFVTGSLSMSKWDDFLNEMEKAGYKQIVAIDQAAYDAMKQQ